MDSPVKRTDSPMALQHIDLCYEHTDSDRSALRLIYNLYPDWEYSEGEVELVRFTDGITNTLLKAIKKRPGWTKQQIDEDAVLLRAYGKGTDVLIDRERETRSHSLLANRGLAPPLLARFENGLLYRFIAGDVCTSEDLQRPEVYRAVARRLAQWHSTLPISAISSVECQDHQDTNGTHTDSHTGATTKNKSLSSRKSLPRPNLWTVVEGWFDALPESSEQERERKQILRTELAQLSSDLGQTPGLDGCDYIFAHCDLLSGNVIVTVPSHENMTVDFIDYEYATPAPAAFDIANHFAEWGGFDCDYNALPTRSQRREFLAEYLRSYRKHASQAPSPNAPSPNAPSFDQELDSLMAQVDLFRGVPGFYWGVWSLIQAQISQIDFDYAAYAEVRLGEYWAWKAETDGSRSSQGKELCLREQRWAQE